METAIDKIKVEKYSSYKNSGTEWLGDIPMHWNTLSNKNIFKLKKNQVGKKSGDYVLLSLTLNGVIKRDMENPQGKFPAEFNTYQEVKKGDFIFCLFDVEETPRCVGLSDFDGMITGAYTVMEPNDNCNRNFLYYFYLNLDADKRLKPLYTGLRNTISKENFFSFKSFVPPKEEQTAIAAFLDRKTALIDQAIDIKQKQIDLLKERRQILIHKAVTRGLNPNIKMKNSGVEWIGEIPEGWDVSKLSNVAQTTSGGTPSSGNVKDYYNGYIPWVRTTDLNNDELFDVPEKITDKAIRDTACKLVPRNTVCIAMYGGAGTIGKHSILRFKGTLNQALCGVIHGERLNSEYLFFYIKFYRPHWMIVAKGSRVDPNISQDEVRRMPITLPPIREQISIVQYIKSSSTKIATAISLKEQEIEKLKEYKATLINSAVTGKIKVS